MVGEKYNCTKKKKILGNKSRSGNNTCVTHVVSSRAQSMSLKSLPELCLPFCKKYVVNLSVEQRICIQICTFSNCMGCNYFKDRSLGVTIFKHSGRM